MENSFKKSVLSRLTLLSFPIAAYLAKQIPAEEEPPLHLPWKRLAVCALGIALGLGLWVFRVSDITGYASNRPEACLNCHVMRPHYASWSTSSHRTAATCNDCHLPQDSAIRRSVFQAWNGTSHAACFTLRRESQVIQLQAAGTKIVQENCLRCHGEQLNRQANVQTNVQTHKRTNDQAGTPQPHFASHTDPDRLCTDCHRETPHGSLRGLAGAPWALGVQPDQMGYNLPKDPP